MSNVFLYRMPAGIAGDLQRREHATVEPGIFDATYPCLAYGILVQIIAGEVRPVASGDDPDGYLMPGFLVRPFPMQEPIGTSAGDEALGGGAPNITLAANVMRRGYMTVQITDGGGDAFSVVAKGDKVYVRITAGSGKFVGDLEAGTTSGNHLVPGAYFMGGVDENGFVEIAYNI